VTRGHIAARILHVSVEEWGRVEAYFARLLNADDPIMDKVRADSQAAGLPAIQVSPLQGKLLEVYARSVRARRILEIGTLGGYSTIWLARALPPGGELLTLELEPRHAEVARANLALAGVADRVEVRVGPAVDSLADLAAAGTEPYDLVFIDADKQSYPDYLTASLTLTRPGSIIIADNVVRQGLVLDPNSADDRIPAVRRFMEELAADPRLDATVVQTVGPKGHDGLAIALVTG
jgi:predicted O-methyltransferase YrrM